jgi:hypothetical protein
MEIINTHITRKSMQLRDSIDPITEKDEADESESEFSESIMTQEVLKERVLMSKTIKMVNLSITSDKKFIWVGDTGASCHF